MADEGRTADRELTPADYSPAQPRPDHHGENEWELLVPVVPAGYHVEVHLPRSPAKARGAEAQVLVVKDERPAGHVHDWRPIMDAGVVEPVLWVCAAIAAHGGRCGKVRTERPT